MQGGSTGEAEEKSWMHGGSTGEVEEKSWMHVDLQILYIMSGWTEFIQTRRILMHMDQHIRALRRYPREFEVEEPLMLSYNESKAIRTRNSCKTKRSKPVIKILCDTGGRECRRGDHSGRWQIENWRWLGVVPRLPACRCQTYVTGSRVFPLVEWEKCLMCMSGRLKCGLIRWTG